MYNNDEFRRNTIQSLPAGEQRLFMSMLVEWADEDGSCLLEEERQATACVELRVNRIQMEQLLLVSQQEGWLSYEDAGPEGLRIQLN